MTHIALPPSGTYRLPTNPAEYPQLLRGPTNRWWRVLAALGVYLFLYFITMLGVTVVVNFAGLPLTGNPVQLQDPRSFTLLLVGLAMLIPISLVTVRVAYGVPMGFVSSVIGRFRWGWALRCAGVLLPIWLASLLVNLALGGFPGGGPSPRLALMLILTLLLVPLQSAGEEYAFRGAVQQVIGGLFRNRWLALTVPTALTVTGFALAHGSIDPWILSSLVIFASSASYMTWRTGGLEAACVMHAVNNVVYMSGGLIFGGFTDLFIGGTSTATPVTALTSLIVQGLGVTAVVWQSRKHQVQRTSTATVAPPLSSPPGAPVAMTGVDQLGDPPPTADQPTKPNAGFVRPPTPTDAPRSTQ